jgi:hypothetical protein
MATVFYLLAGITALIGVACIGMIQQVQTSAVPSPQPVLELQAGLAFLIAAVFMAAGAIVSRLDALLRIQKTQGIPPLT